VSEVGELSEAPPFSGRAPEALAAWGAGALPGDGTLELIPLEAETSTSNEMYELRRGDLRWVLRRPPPVKNAPSAHDVLREFRLLRALEQTDVPHSAPIVACEDPAVFERPFYVMEFVDGFSPEAPLPQSFASPAARRELGLGLVDALATVGAVDWRAVGLEGFGREDGFLERQVDRWRGQLEQYRTRELDGLETLTSWLTDNRPPTWQSGLMHGDYSFFNVRFAPTTPVRMAAIIDWETATIGDPLMDIGWVLAQWSAPGGKEIVDGGVTSLAGMPSRAELAARYRERSGRSLEYIDFYMALAVFKLACIVEGAYTRLISGAETHHAHSARHRSYGRWVPELIQHGLEIAAGRWPTGVASA
jgi:aminoglycoside phosphotransferase (APT) family kinase protein